MKRMHWSYDRLEKAMLPKWLFVPGFEDYRRITVIAYGSVFAAIAILLIIAVLRFIQHDSIPAYINLAVAACLAALAFYHRRTKKYDNDVVAQLGIAFFGIYCFYLFFFNGERSTFLWSYTFPLIALILIGLRRGTVAALLFLIPVFLLLVLGPFTSYITYPSREIIFSYIPSILTVTGIAYLYEKIRKRYQRQLTLVNTSLQRSNDEMEDRIRQRTEELARSEKKYRFLADRMSDIIWTVDMGMNMTYVSPSVFRVLGFTPEEYMSIPFQERVTPESYDKAMSILVAETEADKIPGIDLDRHIQTELQFRRKDGTLVWMENVFNAIRDNQGNLVGIHGVSRDIGERKRMEAEHKNLEERLNRLEKMEALGNMAGGVAHDLNNILGILVGYSELLSYDIDKNDPLREHVENIMNSGERAAAVVQDLLTMARRGVVMRETANLNEIVAHQLKTPEVMKLTLSNPQIRTITHFDEELLNIMASPVHVGKALTNLILNAVEAIPAAGEIKIRTENRYLDRPVEGYEDVKTGDYAVLSVSDTGSGIFPEDLKHIFEPFYTRKVMGRSGTGLGLSVVWGTVKDHDGYIDVTSEPGRGTSFTLYFPVIREELRKEKANISTQHMGKGERILIVDDEEGQRKLASRMLTKLNYKAEAVASGEEAVTYLRQHDADLIVLDMIMDPGIDGLETYRRILEVKKRQKAILVSGFSETTRVEAAKELGAGVFVKKPYLTDQLGLAVRRELDRK